VKAIVTAIGDGGRVEPIERRPDGHLDNNPDPQGHMITIFLGASAHSKTLEEA
jgi:hypothetical protein